jgi:type VI protein secretion system component Hcp
MPKRRRWEEELEELEERERATKPQLSQLDEGKRATVLQELQRAGGNRALQQVVGAQALQREAATAAAAPRVTQPFMKIKGITGPSKVKGFEGAFELDKDYELEVSTPTSSETGLPTAKRRYSELKVVVRKSAGVTSLRQAIVGNQLLEEIVLVAPVEDAVETTTLSKASVVGVKDLGNGTVEVRFVFEKIIWDAGSITATDAPRASGG